MDDRWGDILYIVFMVLLLAIGAMKKRKTKKKVFSEQAEAQEGDQLSGFEMVLENFLGEENVQSLKGQEDLEKASFTEQEFAKDVDTEKGREEIETFSREEFVKEKENQKPEFQAESKLTDEDEDVNWRQAIIYSEILNRRHN